MSEPITIPAPSSLNGTIGLGDAEMHFCDMPLGEGAQHVLREKFALSSQREMLHHLPAMLNDGTIYLGDLARNEIQIVGVRRVYTHRFWTELQLSVKMPPKKKGGEPISAAFAGIMPGHKFEPGVSVLPIVDRTHVVLIENYRFHGCSAETIPGRGKGWRKESMRGGYRPGEDKFAGAKREAGEEAGVRVKEDAKLTDLGQVEPDSGLLMSRVDIVAIQGIEIDETLVNLDVTEAPTKTLVLPVKDVARMISRGEITCGITVMGFTRALLQGLIAYE